MKKLKKHHYLHLSRIFMLLAGAVFFLNQKGITLADEVELNSGNITGSPYHCPTNAKACYLQEKGITSIATDTFINHTSLTQLSLDYNQITSIESGAFNGLPLLTELGLSYNQITSIEEGDFNGLSSLYRLYLHNNQITSIEEGSFNGLSSLYRLYLHNNQITSIEEGGFNGLSSLTTLYLRGNQITSIEEGDFNGLSSLTRLGLGNNQITNIEPGSFDGLSSLTQLDLDNNQITSIGSGAFNGLSSLTSLPLYYNQITSIGSGAFNGLSSLTQLDIGGNPIISIESGYLESLNLESLGLYENCLDVSLLSPSIKALADDYRGAWQPSWQDYQYVCPHIVYDPGDGTFPSTGTIILTGGDPVKRAQINAENPDLSSYTYTWTSNYAHGIDIGGLSDNNSLLHSTYMGYTILTGYGIGNLGGGTTPPTPPPALKSYFSGYEDSTSGSRLDVQLNNFKFNDLWKSVISTDIVYDIIINARNTLGRATTTEDRIPLPGGFRYSLPETLEDGEETSIQLEVKYFNKD